MQMGFDTLNQIDVHTQMFTHKWLLRPGYPKCSPRVGRCSWLTRRGLKKSYLAACLILYPAVYLIPDPKLCPIPDPVLCLSPDPPWDSWSLRFPSLENRVGKRFTSKRKIFDIGKKSKIVLNLTTPFTVMQLPLTHTQLQLLRMLSVIGAVSNILKIHANIEEKNAYLILFYVVPFRLCSSSLEFSPLLTVLLVSAGCLVRMRRKMPRPKKCCDQTDQKFRWHCVVVSFSSLD